jgi:hypothetical protein
MRAGSPVDLPVPEPTGTALHKRSASGLRFTRTYRAGIDALMAHWREPLLRDRWLKPLAGTRFTLLHPAPAYLEAEETDGLHAVRISATFEDDGELTAVRLTIAPMPPLTIDRLIATGYADRWEERLYHLADQVTRTP